MWPPRRPKIRKPPKRKKVRRVCRPYRKWLVDEFGCAGCGTFGADGNPVEAAHLRLGTGGGTGVKPSDRWLLPLCHKCHHGEQHQKGERTFWDRRDINAKALCEDLARKSPYWSTLREMP